MSQGTQERTAELAVVAEPIESKPGYLTTEFWILLLINVLPEIGAIDVGDTKLKGLLHIVSTLGYILSRGIAKAGVPNIVPVQGTPLNVTTPTGTGGSGGDEDGPGDGEHPAVIQYPIADSSADDDHDDSAAAGDRA